MLQIEDDGPTDNIHTAYFVDFPSDDTSKITIKWETRKVESIDLSRVCLDAAPRKRRATDFYKDVGNTTRLGSSTKKKRANGKTGRQVRKPKAKKNIIETIDLLSTSSSDDTAFSYAAKKSYPQEVVQKLPTSDSSDDESDAMSDGSEDDSHHRPTPLSCKTSLRKIPKSYNEDSSAAGNDREAGRKLDMESVSSDSDANEHESKQARSKPKKTLVLRGYTVSSKQAMTSGSKLKKYKGGDLNGTNFEEYLSNMLESLKTCGDDESEGVLLYYLLLIIAT